MRGFSCGEKGRSKRAPFLFFQKDLKNYLIVWVLSILKKKEFPISNLTNLWNSFRF
jgi:hypothetical protein